MSRGRRRKEGKKVHKNKYEKDSKADSELARLSKPPKEPKPVKPSYARPSSLGYSPFGSNSSSYDDGVSAFFGIPRRETRASRPSSLESVPLSASSRAPLRSSSSRTITRGEISEFMGYWEIIGDSSIKFRTREDHHYESDGFLAREVPEAYFQLQGLSVPLHEERFARIRLNQTPVIVEVYGEGSEIRKVSFPYTLNSGRTNDPFEVPDLTNHASLVDLTR